MLIADSNRISFRNKVLTKFTPKINRSNISKSHNSKSTDKLATINRLFPSILAKSPKKTNEITK